MERLSSVPVTRNFLFTVILPTIAPLAPLLGVLSSLRQAVDVQVVVLAAILLVDRMS